MPESQTDPAAPPTRARSAWEYLELALREEDGVFFGYGPGTLCPYRAYRELFRVGWTADLVHTLGDLARTAVDQQTYLARSLLHTTPERTTKAVGQALVDRAGAWRARRRPIGDTLGWLVVFAQARTEQAFLPLTLTDSRTTVRAWTQAYGPAWAPVVWAAGLGKDEARMPRAAAARADWEMQVAGLAALSGYRIPRLPEERLPRWWEIPR